MTTYHSISLEILQDLIEPILGEILVESLLNEKVLRDKYGSLQNPKLINDNNESSNRMEIIDNRLVFQGANFQAAAAASASNSTHGTPGVSNGNGNNNNNNSNNNNGNANGEYFQCLNCERKIAGSRFAAHIDKCLGGRTRGK